MTINKNMIIRIAVSLLAIPLIILTILYGKIAFLLFTLAIALVSFNEYSIFTKNKNANVHKLLGNISVATIVLNSYFSFIDFKSLFILSMLSISFYELFRNKNSAITNIGTSLLGIMYIGLFASTFVSIREFFTSYYVNGGYMILSTIITIWVCDSAAYFFGMAFGKHKMFPRVSPKKSWEGSVAGFVFAVIAMVVLRHFLLDFLSLEKALFLGALIGIFGQIGDLIESLFKRDANVKDSSNLIPGHGGFFDRFDSLLYVSPIVFLFITYFCK